MRALMLGLVLAVAVGCGGRQVETTTSAAPMRSDMTLEVRNNLSQGVNVYVLTGGSDVFLRQVPANSTERLPVMGVASGANVILRAVTVDGSRTYTKENVTLSGSYSWQVP